MGPDALGLTEKQHVEIKALITKFIDQLGDVFRGRRVVFPITGADPFGFLVLVEAFLSDVVLTGEDGVDSVDESVVVVWIEVTSVPEPVASSRALGHFFCISFLAE